MVKNKFPKQGDLVWVNLNPTAGHEQSGERPALVVSGNEYNKNSGLALICPVTSKVKGFPFEVTFKAKKISGNVLADQVRCIDWSNPKRKFRIIETVDKEVLNIVCDKIHSLVDVV